MIDWTYEKFECAEDKHENKSWTSSEYSKILHPSVIRPSFHSYLSLQTLSDSNLDEGQCRMVKLNNTIKKLLDVIHDPLQKEDIGYICCLLCEFLKYNGFEGYYLEHLHEVDEILEFLSMQAKYIDEYLDFLYEMVKLCAKAPLFRKSSELLLQAPKLQRHLSLLGYLLVLAPTQNSFVLIKIAIEQLLGHSSVEKRRKDKIKLSMCREAIESSRLPIILAELLVISSTDIYTYILEILLVILPFQTLSCIKLFEVGIENQLLLRMHPIYELGYEFFPNSEDNNLKLHGDNYYKIAEMSTKILWQLTTTIILSKDASKNLNIFKSPSENAMRSLRVAFRREILHAQSSLRSRKLRNNLTSLILANLVGRAFGLEWDFVESAIADDLAIVAAATECGTQGTWAANAIIETRSQSDLVFKRTLLLIVALLVETQPQVVQIMKNRKIMCGLLKLLNPNFEVKKTFWNLEQLWHLFKYVSNALTYLAPKIPEQFIECSGSISLLLMLDKLEDEFDNTHTTYLTEMICSLSSENCDLIINDFRKYKFVPSLLKLVNQILDFEVLTIIHQKIITFILITNQNIMENQDSLQEINRHSIVRTALNLLQRCLHQKCEDSKLEQSFVIAIGCFIWKCLVTCSNSLNDFLIEGGIYLILDVMENLNLCIQNFYLGILIDMCESESSFHYLFTWRCANKKKGLLSLLVHIWKEEKKVFELKRKLNNCENDVESLLINDDKTLYLYFIKSIRNLSTIITTATHPARPKIYFITMLMRSIGKESCWKKLFNGLSIEEQVN